MTPDFRKSILIHPLGMLNFNTDHQVIRFSQRESLSVNMRTWNPLVSEIGFNMVMM
jgi:hypothetical protein